MKKGLCPAGFILLSQMMVLAQKTVLIYPHKYRVKVYTPDRKIKGRLYHLAESSIWVFDKRRKKDLLITVPIFTIDKIDFTSNEHFGKSLLEGIVIGVLSMSAAWLEGNMKNDLSFFEANLFGVGVGLVVGVGLNLKPKFSYKIYRKQHLFKKTGKTSNHLLTHAL